MLLVVVVRIRTHTQTHHTHLYYLIRCIAGSDFSRGFLCPWCKIGTLFPPVGLEREAFYCNRCQKFDWETEWSRLERQEKELEKLFKSWETQIEKSNKQHGGNLGTVKVSIK